MLLWFIILQKVNMRDIKIINAPLSVDVRVISKEEGYDTVVYRLIKDYSVEFMLDGKLEILGVTSGMDFDEDSVPRIPFLYAAAKGISSGVPATTHDFIYKNNTYPRAVCDALYYNLMLHCGVDKWKALPIYTAVRALGGSHY